MNPRISWKMPWLWIHFIAVLIPFQMSYRCPKFFTFLGRVFSQKKGYLVSLLKYHSKYENYILTWSLALPWAIAPHSYFFWLWWVYFLIDSDLYSVWIAWNFKEPLVGFAYKDFYHTINFSLFSQPWVSETPLMSWYFWSRLPRSCLIF